MKEYFIQEKCRSLLEFEKKEESNAFAILTQCDALNAETCKYIRKKEIIRKSEDVNLNDGIRLMESMLNLMLEVFQVGI
ncbi:hypothetical protein OAL86_03180 [Verrucomicrobia bacterium]|nr:hypothetical protein [Verrucomicrobiota bacterium]